MRHNILNYPATIYPGGHYCASLLQSRLDRMVENTQSDGKRLAKLNILRSNSHLSMELRIREPAYERRSDYI